MKFGLFNYFPETHYKKAVDQAFQERAEDNLETDGGSTLTEALVSYREWR
jgi:hypothetical protein